jgi:hypothetical protein
MVGHILSWAEVPGSVGLEDEELSNHDTSGANTVD